MSESRFGRPDDVAVQEFWDGLRRTTQARIGLGRAGDALPTRDVLEIRAAHAAARDAVHTPLDVAALAAEAAALGLGDPIHVRSLAGDRSEYLRRPDLGRLPGAVTPCAPARPEPVPATRARTIWSGADTAAGASVPHSGADVGFVLADGLSPRALADHGVPMLAALAAAMGERYTLAPPVIATQARVALGDHIGAALGVTTVLVLIGERPGLSVADSLGIYLTHRPRPGRTDAERNCISNIHPPEGLTYARAAQIATGLLDGARRLGRSGVELKDTSPAAPAVAAAVTSAPLILDAHSRPPDRARQVHPPLALDLANPD
ncbi:ethanolamine ammonia-lyase subunit EutC [Nocardia yunnanensis]|uniref:Ethanolamine ammonia-lyase small subunit n=1 Tax=Nocardia yunnanensis TaxID=2382165 RepID=A0A386ZIH8_9NOCA|nr:ethanolamine ammonia-lyase subunit EutC [Nocardia yunnanensis]AYF76924.1 ethanolamine ammonia-lyase subunit EutC [Nocardia yunnanensis]